MYRELQALLADVAWSLPGGIPPSVYELHYGSWRQLKTPSECWDAPAYTATRQQTVSESHLSRVSHHEGAVLAAKGETLLYGYPVYRTSSKVASSEYIFDPSLQSFSIPRFQGWVSSITAAPPGSFHALTICRRAPFFRILACRQCDTRIVEHAVPMRYTLSASTVYGNCVVTYHVKRCKSARN